MLYLNKFLYSVFYNVQMRFTTTSGGLFQAAYAQWQQITIMRYNYYTLMLCLQLE
jgi:hypothetical protein